MMHPTPPFGRQFHLFNYPCSELPEDGVVMSMMSGHRLRRLSLLQQIDQVGGGGVGYYLCIQRRLLI